MEKKLKRRSVQLRVTEDVIRQIDKLKELIEANAKLTMSRSDVLSAVIDYGIDEMERRWLLISKQ